LKNKDILIKDYSYSLPDEKIAKYPLEHRSDSKLLIYKESEITESSSSQIADHLPNEGLIVFNNTKVIQARLIFYKETGARIEIFCLSPKTPADFESSLSSTKSCVWTCIAGNAKKWKSGKIKLTAFIDGKETEVFAEKLSRENANFIIEFTWDSESLSFSEILDSAGATPIPPYMNRKSEESDKDRYQTVYSQHDGSVAAPTAGLHFTDRTLKSISNNGVGQDYVTLHVGAGIFKPVKSETVGEHEMHAEFFSVSSQTLKNIRENLGKIIAVGTTSVRTLESLYWLGVKLIENKEIQTLSQWEAYELKSDISVDDAMSAVESFSKNNNGEVSSNTQIMITPGYEFKIVNQLVTNFHQPQSTLLLLISAFIGEDWKKVYNYALENNFRFLSYGDSSLLIP